MTRTASRRLYERASLAADRDRWSGERDIAWEAIDSARARAQTELLAALRAAAIVESLRSIALAQLLNATTGDMDASVVFCLQLYDELKHFRALRRYLELVGYEPAITDEEVVRFRRSPAQAAIDPGDLVGGLVEMMLSVHFAHYFFRRLGERAEDPVLADLLFRVSADDLRHADSISELIAKLIAADPVGVTRVLDAAADFCQRRVWPAGAVPIAQAGDPIAIQAFTARIEWLCGTRLVDHLKQRL